MEEYTMSQKQLKHYRLAMDVIDGKLTIKDFSIQIKKSYRQAQRIINKIKEKYGIEETKHLIKQLMKEQELRDNMLWSPL